MPAFCARRPHEPNPNQFVLRTSNEFCVSCFDYLTGLTSVNVRLHVEGGTLIQVFILLQAVAHGFARLDVGSSWKNYSLL